MVTDHMDLDAGDRCVKRWVLVQHQKTLSDHFVHRPEFYTKNLTVRKLDLFPYSGEGKETPVGFFKKSEPQSLPERCFLVI
jgi:hypothetical protein